MSRKSLKICYVTEDFYPQIIGGQGIHGYHLVKGLLRRDHQLTVLAEGKKGRRKFWQSKKNVQVILVPFCFGNQLILAIFEYLAFRFKLSGQKFDILHANQLSGLLFVLFKPRNVGKVIIQEWNTHWEMRKHTKSLVKKVIYLPLILLEWLLYSLADGIIFDSPQEEEEFEKFLKLKIKPRAAVYLGSERVEFTDKEKNHARVNLRMRLGLPKSAKIVLYVGRLVERKRVDSIIKAVEILERNQKGIYGIIVGDGPKRESLEEEAGENIRFLGRDTDLRKYYLASDVFVTVSVAEGGFLLTALGAAKFGLPLILSQSAAGFPIVMEGVNGFVAKPDDLKGLAKKIRLATAKKELMGKESRKIARGFTWEKCVANTADFYRRVKK